jgi:hypothetical protein
LPLYVSPPPCALNVSTSRSIRPPARAGAAVELDLGAPALYEAVCERLEARILSAHQVAAQRVQLVPFSPYGPRGSPRASPGRSVQRGIALREPRMRLPFFGRP